MSHCSRFVSVFGLFTAFVLQLKAFGELCWYSDYTDYKNVRVVVKKGSVSTSLLKQQMFFFLFEYASVY